MQEREFMHLRKLLHFTGSAKRRGISGQKRQHTIRALPNPTAELTFQRLYADGRFDRIIA